MANTIIQLRHSTVQGNVPVSLANGEISINTRDGKLFYAQPDGTVTEFSGFTGPSGLNGEIQFNDAGTLGADSGLTYNKTTKVLTVVGGAIVGGINVAPQIQFAYNHANAAFEQANSSGGGGAVTVSTFNATANGAQTTFEIGFSPVSADAVQVTIDGLIQPETSYTANANANTITFLTAPASGEQVRVLSFYTGASAFVINDGSISPIKLSASTNNYINSIATAAATAEALSMAAALAIALG